MTYEEKTLTCQTCGQQFAYTAGEQVFHEKKGFASEPSRCPDCRGARKTHGESSSSGSHARGGQQTKFPAVCVQCGKDTQLSTQPRGDRPVYCPACSPEEQGSSSGYRRPSRGSRY